MKSLRRRALLAILCMTSATAWAAPEPFIENAGLIQSNHERVARFELVSEATPVDGYWKTLKDFGECTLSCGGGRRYMQRMCVPPKNGGKPCEGPPILQQACNTQPCPPRPKAPTAQ